ncbi:MAG: hypothetical protein M3Y82_04690, partial [Verrucomicrobiota bacterium]|nr:hypothetical protein [Verrucomicrobiota bacterium]
MSPHEAAKFVRGALPANGLFAEQEWRISPAPFSLGETLAKEIEKLGRVLLQFNRAVNLLYRRSVEGKQPSWISEWLDAGKPSWLIELQRNVVFKNEIPRVIRPDILLTENGFSISELDSIPGGIGLTAWLHLTYAKIFKQPESIEVIDRPASTAIISKFSASGLDPKWKDQSVLIGGADGMLRGFESIFGDAKNVHIVISEEAATYRPEMEWVANQLGNSRFKIQNSKFSGFEAGDAVYRFFELFDVENISNAKQIFELALEKKIRLTPPPKPIFE